MPEEERNEEEFDEAFEDLIHEAVNIYAQVGIFAPYLEATWFIFNDPALDFILQEAEGSLDTMFSELQISPVVINNEKKLFMACYEFPTYGNDFSFHIADKPDLTIGWIDFLGGMPFGDIEMLGIIGEYSSTREDIQVKKGNGMPVPPIPYRLFEGFGEDRVLFNQMWIASENVIPLASQVAGVPKPQNPHWWLRYFITENKEIKWPVPGEFLGLGVRIFPNLPWGSQESNPFLFSGNWMDTVYYSSGRIKEIIEPDVFKDYYRYKIQRRHQTEEITPTDFFNYEEGKRATILKNIGSSKTSQTWEDDKNFSQDWRLAPISFYEEG